MPGQSEPPRQLLSPDKAFAVLGNHTRIEILQTLADANEPLSFSELRNRVGIRDSGQFNYHLDKLDGHFIRAIDGGYVLRRAGERVVEAVLSGAVTDDPVIEPTSIDFDCLLCGAPVEMSYRQERLELYCTECAGHYSDNEISRESTFGIEYGWLGGFSLPPAGIQGRSTGDLLAAGSTWGHLEILAAAYGICPRCSARVEHSVQVCQDHAVDTHLCGNCNRRQAVQIHRECTNCIYSGHGMFLTHLLGSADLRTFVWEHGVDPIADGVSWGWDYEEDILSIDPFRARFTYVMGEDSITLTVDSELKVVDVMRSD